MPSQPAPSSGKSSTLVTAGVAGALLGAAVGAAAVYATLTTTNPSNTARPTIKTKTDHTIPACNPWPFDKNHHPTEMYQIELTSSPLNIYDLKPVITEMPVLATNNYTVGDVTNAKPYAGAISWTPTTPLDMNLDLAASGATNKHSLVLIRIVVDDPQVKLINEPFTIISNDANKDMFCTFKTGGVVGNSVTFAVNYKGVTGQKDYGSYSVGLIIVTASGQQFPIYLDPEVQNNG
jgi:hypothetical protein